LFNKSVNHVLRISSSLWNLTVSDVTYNNYVRALQVCVTMTLSLKWKAELIYHVTKSCNLIGMHCTVWQDKLMYGRECCHMSSPWLCYIVWPKTVS